MRLVLDKFGRMVLPQALRHEFGLSAGDEMDACREGDAILLRPATRKSVLRQKDGILVFGGEATGDVGGAVAEYRNGRLERAAAWRKPS